LQQLPASPDAFVWLRLYQAQMQGLVPGGRDDSLWWTLRRPFRPLGYDAARAMFNRVNKALGSNHSLHDLRHTAAYRMTRDPGLPLTDVQWIMGHAHLSTTQQYLNRVPADVIASVLAFHARRDSERRQPPPGAPEALLASPARRRPAGTAPRSDRHGTGCGRTCWPGIRRARAGRPGMRPARTASRYSPGRASRRSRYLILLASATGCAGARAS